MMKSTYRAAAALAIFLTVSGCGTTQPLPPVEHVDLERFMGDWYVIANIPTPIERGAHNAVESYRLDSNGTVATTFRFRDGAFDGPIEVYHPRGYVRDESNAVWGMQFVWPIRADYRIAYLNDDYSITVIGRNKRDYVWIMSRQPVIGDQRFRQIVTLIEGWGYDISKLQKVPQRW